jgi:hypothetical protein
LPFGIITSSSTSSSHLVYSTFEVALSGVASMPAQVAWTLFPGAKPDRLPPPSAHTVTTSKFQHVQSVFNVIILVLIGLIVTRPPSPDNSAQISAVRESIQMLLSNSNSQQNSSQVTSAAALIVIQRIVSSLSAIVSKSNVSQSTSVQGIVQQTQTLQSLQEQLQKLAFTAAQLNSTLSTTLLGLQPFQSSVQSTFGTLQSAILNESLPLANTSSVLENNIQSSVAMQNSSLNQQVANFVEIVNATQSVVPLTQSLIPQINETASQFFAQVPARVINLTANYTAACQSSFMPTIPRYFSQGCWRHSAALTMTLNNSTPIVKFANRPNLTMSVTCNSLSVWGGGPIGIQFEVSTPGLTWFSVGIYCDNTAQSGLLQYTGNMTFPKVVSVSLRWDWCGLGDPTVLIASLCTSAVWN